MSELFIPPAGAMQFVRRGDSPILPDQQSCYWVMPGKRIRWSSEDPICSHAGYELLPSALTWRNRAIFDEFKRKGQTLSFCECVGGLIE